MNHLFLAESDYAASGAAFFHAVSLLGGDVRYLTGRMHFYEYPHQPNSLIPKDPEKASQVLTDAVDWADWVWVIQTDLPRAMGGTYGSYIGFFAQRDAWMDRLKNKQIVLLNGGGHYRDHRDFYRQMWAPFKPISICYEADLMGSFDNEHLVIPPLHEAWMTPYYKRSWKDFRVGHYPSRPTDKGSEWIVPCLQGLGVSFSTSVTNPHDEEGAQRLLWIWHLRRMAKADVIVDQIKPELDGKPFGEWVSISSETAMLGRIPIANSLNTKPYTDTYGVSPLVHICNTKDELEREVRRLASLSPQSLEGEQEACREWFKAHHELSPTGKTLKRLCDLA